MHVLVDVLMKVLQKYVNLYNETIKTNKKEFGFTTDQIDLYQLVVKFPTTYKNYKYQGISENIEISFPRIFIDIIFHLNALKMTIVYSVLENFVVVIV